MNPWVILLLVLAWGGAGYWAGDHQRNNAWLAKQAAIDRKDHQNYVAEVERSNAAATNFALEYAAMAKQFSTLERQLDDARKRTPLAVYRHQSGNPVGNGSRCPVVGGLALAPSLVPAPADAPSGADAPVAGPLDAAPAVRPDDLALSLGAVWLWNSALTGVNTPAGACGAAGAPESACAVDAGLGLEAAWDNHALNAKTCALDRLRHQRLIDYLNATPSAAPRAATTP